MNNDQGIAIRTLQKYIQERDLGPQTTDAYFLKLVEEVGELADAIRRDLRQGANGIKGTVEEELYDTLYYVLALANAYGIDLETCCRQKEALNQAKYGTSERKTVL